MESSSARIAPWPDVKVACFGPDAARWGARLFGRSSCVLADATQSAAALEEATQRRRLGHVLTGPVIDEARAVIARRLAPRIVAWTDDGDQRRTMFDALSAGSLEFDGASQSHLRVLDPAVSQTLRDFYLVGSSTVVRSRAQAAYLGKLFGRYRPGFVVAPGLNPDVPIPAPGPTQGTIVLWAPHSDVAELSVHLFALADFKAPIVVIGMGDARAFPNIRVVSLAGAQVELSRASLIIDASLSDPSSAVALAAWKIPLVVARSTGADEFLDAVRLYDPWNWRSILAAVSAARADTAANLTKSGQQAISQVASVPDVADARQGPLVTIIVPTFDRADVLPMALESLEAQSYKNIEIIVVNDGGPAVDHVVARYSRARYVANEQNSGFFTSCNVGIANARGDYIGFLADDDIYYFDHVERLVAALRQSGGQVAHANALTRFLETDAQGRLQTSGNQVIFASPLDVTGALWAGYLGSNLVRKDVFERIGTFDVSNAVADYEMFVRLSRYFDFVHVDQVTFEWRYRTDGSTLTHNLGTTAIIDGLTEIFQRYPSKGDMRVEKGRAATLAFITEHAGLPYWRPPLRLDGGVDR